MADYSCRALVIGHGEGHGVGACRRVEMRCAYCAIGGAVTEVPRIRTDRAITVGRSRPVEAHDIVGDFAREGCSRCHVRGQYRDRFGGGRRGTLVVGHGEADLVGTGGRVSVINDCTGA